MSDFLFSGDFHCVSREDGTEFPPVSLYKKDSYYYAFYKSHLQTPLPDMVNISFVSAKSVQSIHLLVRRLLERGFVFTSLDEYEVFHEQVLFRYRRKVREQLHEINYGIVFSESSISTNFNLN